MLCQCDDRVQEEGLVLDEFFEVGGVVGQDDTVHEKDALERKVVSVEVRYVVEEHFVDLEAANVLDTLEKCN